MYFNAHTGFHSPFYAILNFISFVGLIHGLATPIDQMKNRVRTQNSDTHIRHIEETPFSFYFRHNQ